MIGFSLPMVIAWLNSQSSSFTMEYVGRGYDMVEFIDNGQTRILFFKMGYCMCDEKL